MSIRSSILLFLSLLIVGTVIGCGPDNKGTENPLPPVESVSDLFPEVDEVVLLVVSPEIFTLDGYWMTEVSPHPLNKAIVTVESAIFVNLSILIRPLF